ncbi:hypothetical protein Bca52824_024263 [Brassica carinata]|uniref:Uncharacterized protein n=1 Tax=Brassica carinata TaxID=52824 RepID=A0A8X7VJZ2_BRACI|nr:hypothetical protein Bca52824_024263 [Brassica carinata]
MDSCDEHLPCYSEIMDQLEKECVLSRTGKNTYVLNGDEVARVRHLGDVSRTGFAGGTGTARVRLGNVPNTCAMYPGRRD